MSKINIKMMSDDSVIFAKKNADKISKMIADNSSNSWVSIVFKNCNPLFIEKKYEINEFELELNTKGIDKELDFKNSVLLYENLKKLPGFVLSNENFWMWLEFDKFYSAARDFMPINDKNTYLDHWTFNRGIRRGIFFGVLSRMYYRVALTVDESLEDKYELTKWIIEKPERFRNLSWRAYSSENHLVRGIIKAEKKFAETCEEKMNYYSEIAKYVSFVGSAKILDSISEKDIEDMVFNKLVEVSKESS